MCLWKVGHVQQSVSSVRKMAKYTLKEFEKVSEVSNTSPNMRIFGMVVSQDGHALFPFASHCSSSTHQPCHNFEACKSTGI